MKSAKSLFSIGLCLFLAVSCSAPVPETIDLAGSWQFMMDPEDRGIKETWHLKTFDEQVVLPGSMAENGKGYDISVDTKWTGGIVDRSWFTEKKYEPYRQPGNIKIPFWLQPEKHYQGAAWYQREIMVPHSWQGTNPVIKLERCHWETRLWIDDQEIGMRNSLGTPQYYSNIKDVLTPGKHTITIRVDNRINAINPGENAHSISDHTQSNWNGLAGELSITAYPVVYMEEVRLYPNPSSQLVKMDVRFVNSSGHDVQAKMNLQAAPLNNPNMEASSPLAFNITLPAGEYDHEIIYPMGPDVMLWDEFYPNLYTMDIRLIASGNEDHKNINFGMREFRTKGTRFIINGRPVFLRGTLECAIFPKTSYPPTDVESWLRVFGICKAHGLNNMRFHSWCPPKAAFEAADRAGFYLQVECSSWANQGSTIGDGKPIDQFIYDESERIIREYGNHPSFCMLAYGNEPAGNHQREWLSKFVKYWQQKDPRRLYTSAAGWPIIPENDFQNIPQPRIQGWGQGLNSIINAQPPSTMYDWQHKIGDISIPVVSHEIGQWCVYPNFKEIPKYTGVLKARNFEIFRETLHNNQMGHLADSFLLASGKLQALCYKADIEAALRTPDFGGFHLLQLHDFPGQGTALVGLLDSFFEEKGYIKPSEFIKFCNQTVPLARMPKRIYNNNENLTADVELAHFGPEHLRSITPSWSIKNINNETIVEGNFTTTEFQWGNVQKLGSIDVPLNDLKQAQKVILEVVVGAFSNTWDLWVYPEVVDEPEGTDQIRVASEIDPATADFLQKGGKVLLTMKKGSVAPDKGGDIGVGFSSIFWNTAWTHGQKPHTLGILCNPAHPALAHFPTEYHSNWQWWDAMSHSQALLLDELDPNLNPIVRIIDDWFTNRRLGLIIEAKVGEGKLIMTGVDLMSDLKNRPEAAQLLYSLKNYMAGSAFDPDIAIDIAEVMDFQRR